MTHPFQNGRLFGLPHSYYTVIARCYLRKQEFDVHEVSSRHSDFAEQIYPRIKRGIIPVFQTIQGDIIQDSLDIIEQGDAYGTAQPAIPSDTKLKLIAYLIFLYGSQALLKPAMHYRWSFYSEQKDFLDHAFGLNAADPASARVMEKMKSYLPILGVTPDTVADIEKGYLKLLSLLDDHFVSQPYLLGHHPTLADYGLIGPLFAHLGRDPVPSNIMKLRAPNVFRWTERMNTHSDDAPEYIHSPDFGATNEIPDTLTALLSFIGDEYGPELDDRIAFIRNWQASNEMFDGAPVSAKPSQRAIGVTNVRYRSNEVQIAVQPYLLYIQRRIQELLTHATDNEQNWGTNLLKKIGLSTLADPDLEFTVARADNIEVWEKV